MPLADFIKDFAGNGEHLAPLRDIEWVQHLNVPRKEYFCGLGTPYSYGKPPNDRTYESQEWPALVSYLRDLLNLRFSATFNVCFLNFYTNERDHLGWHADDSPEMDLDHPIAVVSYGQPRDLHLRPKPTSENPKPPKVETYSMTSGSLLLMPAGLQRTHQHMIAKSSTLGNERISLTFRRYLPKVHP
jgi:alkylated DNA repair dioxygenase AlkB